MVKIENELKNNLFHYKGHENYISTVVCCNGLMSHLTIS